MIQGDVTKLFLAIILPLDKFLGFEGKNESRNEGRDGTNAVIYTLSLWVFIKPSLMFVFGQMQYSPIGKNVDNFFHYGATGWTDWGTVSYEEQKLCQLRTQKDLTGPICWSFSSALYWLALGHGV